MKFARFVSLLAAAALPAFAFAAAPLSVTALSGQARSIIDGEASALKVGSDVLVGSSVETNSGSSAELTLLNGVKIVLSPGTRIRIKQLEVSPGIFSCEIILLRGSVTGDATGAFASSTFTIRTSVGVAGVSGSEFSVGFTPSSSTAGELSVVSLKGAVSVLPVNSTGPVSVPAGSQAVVGAPGSPGVQVNVASASTLSNAKAALAGIASTPGNPTDGTSQANSTGQGSTSNSNSTSSVNLALLSPNGEGQVL